MEQRRISHYEIEATLGEGGMGKVFRARDLNLDRPVALKFLGARLTDPSFKERFRREARLAAQLNHPHIGTIYEFGEEGDEAFIAMELVEGETLEAKIKRGPLSLTQVRQWGSQTASALAAAHALGIVHRDIKPANLMVTRDGRLKVMDFGVARRTGETALTMEGSLVGTVNIMAPEMLKGDRPTGKSDLFSLGCVLYEALTGRSPFPGDDAMAILYQVRNEEPTPVRELRPDVPEDLAALVHALLDKDPETRLGPAEVVAARLSGEAEALGMAPAGVGATVAISLPRGGLEPPKARPEARPRGGPRRGLILGGAGLFVAVAVVGFFVMRPHSSGPSRPPAPVDDPQAVKLNDRAANLVQLYPANRDSLDEAEKLYHRATELDPDYAVPWNNLADLLRRRGKLNVAEAWLREAVKARPDYSLALTNLALVLEDQGALFLKLNKAAEADGKRAEAKALYLRVIETDTTSVYPRNNLGFLYVQTGEAEKALPVLNKAIARFPSEAALYKNRGLAYLAQELPDMAEKDFEKALELDPEYDAALLGRAWAVEAQKPSDPAQAREQISRVRDLWKALLARPGTRAQAEETLKRLGSD